MKFNLHVFGGIHTPRKVLRRRWLIEKLSFKEELSFKIAWLNINFCTEFDNISYDNEFFSVPNKECFSIETISFFNNVRFNQTMIANFSTILRISMLLIYNFCVLSVVVVGIGVEDFVFLFVKDLKLHKIESLLNEINISEMLKM